MKTPYEIISDRIDEGEYPLTTQPSIPRPTGILEKQVCQLSLNDFHEIPNAISEFQEKILKYKHDKDNYKEFVKNAELKFRNDLEEVYGTKDHPKAEQLWNISRDDSFAFIDYHKVNITYSKLVELLQ